MGCNNSVALLQYCAEDKPSNFGELFGLNESHPVYGPTGVLLYDNWAQLLSEDVFPLHDLYYAAVLPQGGNYWLGNDKYRCINEFGFAWREGFFGGDGACVKGMMGIGLQYEPNYASCRSSQSVLCVCMGGTEWIGTPGPTTLGPTLSPTTSIPTPNPTAYPTQSPTTSGPSVSPTVSPTLISAGFASYKANIIYGTSQSPMIFTPYMENLDVVQPVDVIGNEVTSFRVQEDAYYDIRGSLKYTDDSTGYTDQLIRVNISGVIHEVYYNGWPNTARISNNFVHRFYLTVDDRISFLDDTRTFLRSLEVVFERVPSNQEYLLSSAVANKSASSTLITGWHSDGLDTSGSITRSGSTFVVSSTGYYLIDFRANCNDSYLFYQYPYNVEFTISASGINTEFTDPLIESQTGSNDNVYARQFSAVKSYFLESTDELEFWSTVIVAAATSFSFSIDLIITKLPSASIYPISLLQFSSGDNPLTTTTEFNGYPITYIPSSYYNPLVDSAHANIFTPSAVNLSSPDLSIQESGYYMLQMSIRWECEISCYGEHVYFESTHCFFDIESDEGSSIEDATFSTMTVCLLYPDNYMKFGYSSWQSSAADAFEVSVILQKIGDAPPPSSTPTLSPTPPTSAPTVEVSAFSSYRMRPETQFNNVVEYNPLYENPLATVYMEDAYAPKHSVSGLFTIRFSRTVYMDSSVQSVYGVGVHNWIYTPTYTTFVAFDGGGPGTGVPYSSIGSVIYIDALENEELFVDLLDHPGQINLTDAHLSIEKIPNDEGEILIGEFSLSVSSPGTIYEFDVSSWNTVHQDDTNNIAWNNVLGEMTISTDGYYLLETRVYSVITSDIIELFPSNTSVTMKVIMLNGTEISVPLFTWKDRSESVATKFASFDINTCNFFHFRAGDRVTFAGKVEFLNPDTGTMKFTFRVVGFDYYQVSGYPISVLRMGMNETTFNFVDGVEAPILADSYLALSENHHAGFFVPPSSGSHVNVNQSGVYLIYLTLYWYTPQGSIQKLSVQLRNENCLVEAGISERDSNNEIYDIRIGSFATCYLYGGTTLEVFYELDCNPDNCIANMDWEISVMLQKIAEAPPATSMPTTSPTTSTPTISPTPPTNAPTTSPTVGSLQYATYKMNPARTAQQNPEFLPVLEDAALVQAAVEDVNGISQFEIIQPGFYAIHHSCRAVLSGQGSFDTQILVNGGHSYFGARYVGTGITVGSVSARGINGRTLSQGDVVRLLYSSSPAHLETPQCDLIFEYQGGGGSYLSLSIASAQNTGGLTQQQIATLTQNIPDSTGLLTFSGSTLTVTQTGLYYTDVALYFFTPNFNDGFREYHLYLKNTATNNLYPLLRFGAQNGAAETTRLSQSNRKYLDLPAGNYIFVHTSDFTVSVIGYFKIDSYLNFPRPMTIVHTYALTSMVTGSKRTFSLVASGVQDDGLVTVSGSTMTITATGIYLFELNCPLTSANPSTDRTEDFTCNLEGPGDCITGSSYNTNRADSFTIIDVAGSMTCSLEAGDQLQVTLNQKFTPTPATSGFSPNVFITLLN